MTPEKFLYLLYRNNDLRKWYFATGNLSLRYDRNSFRVDNFTAYNDLFKESFIAKAKKAT